MVVAPCDTCVCCCIDATVGIQANMATRVVTYTAPTNIACIKYWGKRVGVDVELNLPLNSSVSVTLNQRELRTVTTVAIGPSYTQDRLWLNGRCVRCPPWRVSHSVA